MLVNTKESSILLAICLFASLIFSTTAYSNDSTQTYDEIVYGSTLQRMIEENNQNLEKLREKNFGEFKGYYDPNLNNIPSNKNSYPLTPPKVIQIQPIKPIELNTQDKSAAEESKNDELIENQTNSEIEDSPNSPQAVNIGSGNNKSLNVAQNPNQSKKYFFRIPELVAWVLYFAVYLYIFSLFIEKDNSINLKSIIWFFIGLPLSIFVVIFGLDLLGIGVSRSHTIDECFEYVWPGRYEPC